MLRSITRNNRLLLTGALVQQALSEAEKLKTTNENSARDQVKESENNERNKTLDLVGNVEEEEISRVRHAEKKVDSSTGWDRVKMAFHYHGDKDLTPELNFIRQLAIIGYIGGFFASGMREYTKAVELYLYSKDANKYLSIKEAKVSLVRFSCKSFFLAGFLKAPKTAALCSIFGASYTFMSAYRGKNGILDFSFAGAVTIAMMKWNLGIRGMISGCVSGGISGLIFGCMVSTLLSLIGSSVSDVQQFLYNFKTMKTSEINDRRRSATMSDIEKYYHEKTESLPIGFSSS